MALSKIDAANFLDGTLPDTNINNASLDNVTGLPAGVGGKVLQVVTATSSTKKATTGTSLVDTNLSASITPSSTSSKIFISCTQIIQVYNSSGNYGTGRWKIVQTIDGSDTDITTGGSTGAGNVFTYDYGGSGINIYRPTNYTLLVSPNTTSTITYKTQIALGTQGGSQVNANDDQDDGVFVLMEVAG